MVNKKKIVVFTHDASLTGGATLSLLTLLEYLSRSDSFTILVISRKQGPLTDALLKINISCRIISYPWNAAFRKHNTNIKGLLRRLWGYRIAYKRLSPVIDEFDPDIIYTNTSVIYWGAFLSFFKKKKHVWHIREMKGQYGIKHDFGFWFFNLLIKGSRRIIVNSEAVKRDYELLNSPECVVIYNGIFNESMLRDHQFSGDNENPAIKRFAIIGAIDSSKGQLEAVQVFAEWNKRMQADCRLSLIGGITDQKYYRDIENYIAENGLNNTVVYEGFHSDMQTKYQEIDAIICSSVVEAFGRILIEAMANRVLVIAKNVGGIPEIVENGSTGFLYNSRTELAECLTKARNADQIQIKAMKDKALQKVMTCFTVEQYVTNIEKLLYAV